jgi:hypothetical protein
MQCQHAHELLSDYVAGQLERPLAITLDSHLGECSACREEAAGLRRVWTELEGMSAVEPPPFFHENLMHRINTELDAQEANIARRRAIWDWRALLRPRALAAGAVALIVLSASVGFLHTQSAGMWPLSVFASHTVAPSLVLEKPTVEWTPDPITEASGTLVVRLQLDGSATANGTELGYTVKSESAEPGVVKSVSGTFLQNGTAIVRFPLSARPNANQDLIVVTATARKDGIEVWQQQVQVRN